MFEPPNQPETGGGEWKLVVCNELGLVWDGAAHCDDTRNTSSTGISKVIIPVVMLPGEPSVKL